MKRDEFIDKWSISDTEWHRKIRSEFIKDLDELLDNCLQKEEESKCNGNCGMNYCDENGCVERKRVLTNPIEITPPTK